jgi:hypothetical protein
MTFGQPMAINWTSGSVKVVGFYFGNGDLLDQNWKPVINKFRAILNLWMHGLIYVGDNCCFKLFSE